MQMQTIQNKIIALREQQVMLDFDLAELYGVETRALKQAVPSYISDNVICWKWLNSLKPKQKAKKQLLDKIAETFSQYSYSESEDKLRSTGIFSILPPNSERYYEEQMTRTNLETEIKRREKEYFKENLKKNIRTNWFI
jgi:hypothetical protein